jgi:hypothetical protein
MRARQFESECYRLEQLLRSRPPPAPEIQEHHHDEEEEDNEDDYPSRFLDFSLRDEVLYGDKSFFENLSMIDCCVPHTLTYTELSNTAQMA